MSHQPAKSLVFKVPSQKIVNVAEVGDNTTGIVEILRRGCFTPEEEITWQEWGSRTNQVATGDRTWISMQIEIVTKFLQIRHDRAWTEADTIGFEDEGLITALYDFFSKERSRHVPEPTVLKVQGEIAQNIAVEYAKKLKGVAVTRPDLEAIKTYFVYATKAEVPEGFDIVVSFAVDDEPELQEISTGKSKGKQTGTQSTGS